MSNSTEAPKQQMTRDEAWEFLRNMDDQFFRPAYRNVASISLDIDYHGSGQGISSSDMSHRMVDYIIETDGELGKLMPIFLYLKSEWEHMNGRKWA